MLCQTIDELLPLLEMLPQPAFCVRDDGSVVSNRAARHLSPLSSEAMPLWLGTAAPTFAQWDKVGTIELPITAAGRSYSAVLRAVRDGFLCLMQDLNTDPAEGSALAVASHVLRIPLSDLSVQLQQTADSATDDALLARTAAMQRHLYRISRIAANLTDLDLLRTGRYPLHLQLFNTADLENTLHQELADLLAETNHSLRWDAPKQPATLIADRSLVFRAILNLISNALKYSPSGTPVAIRIHDLSDRLVIQVENQCSDDATSLLRGAFDRLRQRDLLPDPRWGVGLGLPLVQAISQAHNGMTALEVRDGSVIVTMTLSRRRSMEPPVARAPFFSYDGGMRQTLLELSDCLPNHVYHRDSI